MKKIKLVLAVWMIICTFLFSYGLMSGYSALGQKNMNSNSEQQPQNELQNYTQPDTMPDTQPVKQNNNVRQKQYKPVNILMLGLDESKTRADVIMVLNVDVTNDKMSIISIPRDTYIKLNTRNAKVNETYGIGKEKSTINAVENMLGIKIDYYLTADFAGFRNIIDTLGGVEVDVPMDMNYEDPDQDLYIHLKKGRQVLDGSKAEQLIRYRKGNTNGSGYKDGDIGRIHMQQQFISELIRQKFRFRYISKVDDLYFIMKKYIRTNIEMKDIYDYLPGLRQMNLGDVRALSLPGEPDYIDNIWYFIHDAKKTKEMVKSNFAF